jgi:excisionase family DNA binding protein
MTGTALAPLNSSSWPTFEALPDLLTVEEASDYLRIGRNSAYAAVQRGFIPSLRFGVSIRVPKSGLARLLAPEAVG